MKNLLKKYSHAWVMGYILLYLPWFFYLEGKTGGKYTIMHTAVDDMIPFNEYFILPYLFWFVYVAGTVLYFFFTSRADYYKLCGFLFVGMTICMIVFMVYPNGTDLRVPVNPDKNLCSWLVAMIHAADTSTNVFPSIHVYNSLGVHFSIVNSARLREKKWVRRASFVIMAAICFSTVALKQHSVLEVAGALILSCVMSPAVYSIDYAPSRRTANQKIIG